MNLIKKALLKRKSRCKAAFIIGCPRSGTTLAKRYLGTHPDCHIAPYVGLYKPSEEDVIRVYEYLSFNKTTVFKQTSWIVDSENWGEYKTAIHFLKTYFPNAYFILSIRHPSATLVSLKESERHPEVPKDSRFPDWWVDLYENTLNELKGQSYTTVRYEDLVQKPFETKKKFCHFLGIDDEKTPEDTHYEVPQTGDPEVHLYEDSKCLNTNKIHTASLNRRDESMVISDRLRKFARRYQYEL